MKRLFSLIKKDKIINFFSEIVIIIVGVLLAFYLTKLGDSQKTRPNGKGNNKTSLF
ncbi:MAG: hypothetical protein HC892_10275 [Saprospiraceae bacterium]|nr:hypothetical protein [Saprospiraceae bacterium]